MQNPSIDMKSKRALMGQKFYQPLEGGGTSNGAAHQSFASNMHHSSPTQNQDLEQIMRNEYPAGGAATKGKKKSSVDDIMRSARGEGSSQSRSRDKPSGGRLSKHRDSNQQESMQVSKAVITPKQQKAKPGVINAQGNLKYHVIRQLLEKADPEEVRKLMESRLNNQTASSENQSSKEVNASLLLGESLLMENSEHKDAAASINHRLIGSSKLKRRQKKNDTTEEERRSAAEVTSLQQEHKSTARIETTNHASSSLQRLIQQQMDLKNSMITDEDRQRLSQRFQIRISSNSREATTRNEATVLVLRSSQQRQSRGGSRTRQGFGGGITSGYATVYGQANRNNRLQISQSKIYHGMSPSAKAIPETSKAAANQRWEDTLCVHIRQLPIYSKDGTAMPLQSFAKSNAHLKQQAQKGLNPSSKDGGSSASKRNIWGDQGSRFIRGAADLKFKTSRQKFMSSKVNFDRGKQSVSGGITNLLAKGVMVSNSVDVPPQPHGSLSHSPEGTPGGGSPPFKAIRVPQIEIQQEAALRKSMIALGQNACAPPQNYPYISQGIDDMSPPQSSPPKRLPPPAITQEKRRQSEKPMAFIPPGFAHPQQSFVQSSMQNLGRRNSHMAAKENKELIPNSMSQQSMRGLNSDNSHILQPTLHQASTLMQQSQVQKDQSPIPAVLVINNSSSDLQKMPHNVDEKHSITMTIAGQRLSLDANYSVSSQQPHLATHQIVLKEPQSNPRNLLPLNQSLLLSGGGDGAEKRTLRPLNLQQLHNRPRNPHSRMGPLYQTQPSRDDESDKKERIIALPSLNKKYLVSLQQQLQNVTERTTKKRELRGRGRDRVSQEEEEATRQKLVINSFERLSKHMKQRNLLRYLGGPSTTDNKGGRFQKDCDSLLALNSTADYQLNPMISGITIDEGSSLPTNNSDLPPFGSMQSQKDCCGSLLQMMRGGSTKHQDNAAALFNTSKNNKFFRALQESQAHNSGGGDPGDNNQETRLMRKTQQLMKMASLNTSDRLKTKCYLTRGAYCGFQVVRNQLPIQVQQYQLSRILKVVPENELLQQVPFLKQTCLVEYIKNQWPQAMAGKRTMVDYQFFTLYYPERQCYNMIIFGNETPVSRCCHQLIVFQFHQPKTRLNVDSSSVFFDNLAAPQEYGEATLKVFCSQAECSGTPLHNMLIESRHFIESILNTPNGATLVPKGGGHSCQYKTQNINKQSTERFGGSPRRLDKGAATNFSSDHNLGDLENDSMIKKLSGGGGGAVSDFIEDDEEEGVARETYNDDFNYDSHEYLRPGSRGYQKDESSPRSRPGGANEAPQRAGKHRKRANPPQQVTSEQMNIQERQEEDNVREEYYQREQQFRGGEATRIVSDISINKYFARRQSNQAKVAQSVQN